MKMKLKNYFYTQTNKYLPKLKGIKKYFKASCFWSFDQQSIARGVAAGLAGAVIPGFQFFYAAFLAVILRGNLPVALLFTFITNPLTVIPITTFIYFIGTLVIQNGKTTFVMKNINWDFSSFHGFFSSISAWFLQFGKAFLIGLPIVSLCLGLIGYFGTFLVWKAYNYLSNKRVK